jgi:anti-sigma B factor antagonist
MRGTAMTTFRHLRVERCADTLVAHFLDSKIAAEVAISTLGGELYAVVGRPDCQKLVLDFCDVEFLSSAMLGKLISVNRKMKEKGGVLKLCEVCPNIRTILKYTCLEQILDIRDTQAEAVAACG